MAGSHTVLRLPAGRQAGDEDIQYAADLAAWFSKGRTMTKADVIVAKAANVKKVKGAKPGQVRVTKEELNAVAKPANAAAAANAAGGDA